MITIKSFYTNGHILIHRKMLAWEWYDDIYTCRLFLHLLITVNWYDEKWKGILIKRGQRIVSYNTLSQETKLTVRQVRTAIAHLKSTNEITMNMTQSQSKKYSVITVLNYDLYQVADKVSDTEIDNQATSQRQSSDKVTTQNKEVKENKEINNKICSSVSLDEELKKNFEIIYSIYPKKVGKQTAYQNYKKWVTGKKIDGKKVKLTNKQIYNAVYGYVKSKNEAGSELQYYKDFSTLMGKQLLDYLIEEEKESDD